MSETSPTGAPSNLLSVESLHFMSGDRLPEGQWDSFLASVGGWAYQSWNWTRVWLEHYQGEREARILVFREGERVVGLVPLVIDNVNLGPVRVRVAKPVHADFEFAPCDPSVHPDFLEPTLDALLHRVFHVERCDVLATGPLTDESGAAALYRVRALERKGVQVHEGQVRPHMLIDLPASLDAFLAGLDDAERQAATRAADALETDCRVRSEVVDDPEALAEDLEGFIRMQAQEAMWSGRHYHFDDWPGATDFARALVVNEAVRGRVTLHRLVADDEVVAMQLGFRFGERLHWRLTTRAIGDRWSRYDLARAGALALVEHAIGAGVKQIEADADVGVDRPVPGARSAPLHSTVIVRAGLPSRSRAALLSGWSRALDFGYYRVWRQQVAPRLRLPVHELAGEWIRTRL